MGTTHIDEAGAAPFCGNDRLLLGIVLAVLTFWLFAGTVGTAAPAMMRDLEQRGSRITPEQMNLAVSVTALVSGLLIVFIGGLADRLGRVRVTLAGLGAGILGSLLVVLATGLLRGPDR